MVVVVGEKEGTVSEKGAGKGLPSIGAVVAGCDGGKWGTCPTRWVRVPPWGVEKSKKYYSAECGVVEGKTKVKVMKEGETISWGVRRRAVET